MNLKAASLVMALLMALWTLPVFAIHEPGHTATSSAVSLKIGRSSLTAFAKPLKDDTIPRYYLTSTSTPMPTKSTRYFPAMAQSHFSGKKVPEVPARQPPRFEKPAPLKGGLSATGGFIRRPTRLEPPSPIDVRTKPART